MLRVFVPTSPEGYHVKEINSDNHSIKEYPYTFVVRKPEHGGTAADWRWAGIEDPYPKDKIMSQAAYLCYMSHILN